ncbi:hypothetical protein [Faecalimonas sp.]
MTWFKAIVGYNDFTNTDFYREYKVVDLQDLSEDLLDLVDTGNQPIDFSITYNGKTVQQINKVEIYNPNSGYVCFDIHTYSTDDEIEDTYHVAVENEEYMKYGIKNEVVNQTWGSVCEDDLYKSILLDCILTAIDLSTKKVVKLSYDDFEDELASDDLIGCGQCIVNLNLGLQVNACYDKDGIISIDDNNVILKKA